jgi:uridine kinase
MKKKPFVIGIAGGSASGKSTLCEQLEERLSHNKLKVFHMDKYFKKPEQRPHVKAPVVNKVYMDDNHPLTMDLPALKDNLTSAIQEDHDIIIVEGLLVLWDDNIYPLLDLKLFIDCRADERIVRRTRRNMEWGLSFDEITNVYLDMVRYRHDEYVEPSKWRADLILNGSHQSETALTMIVNQIEASI